MIALLLFSGIVISIIKANGWIIVPNFCVVFCWVMSFFSWIIYSYAKGIGEGIGKKMKEKEKKDES